jgi:cysteine desulfurase / selenocysteine lyase
MPVTKKFAYFDHAAVAPLPEKSWQALQAYAEQAALLGDTIWPSWAAGVERLRSNAAQLIGAQLEEVALVPNTTTGIGLVAEGYPWRPGDSVVVPENEFPSNLTPWRNLARKGVEVREVQAEADGRIALEAILAAIDGTTRLVAVSWVGFVSGCRIDVAKFAEAVHARGALLMLDAIQGLGPFPIDVAQCGVDFLAADGHKWLLGPEGAGIFYVRRAHLELLEPLLVGWGSLEAAHAFDPAMRGLKTTARRYEGGAANMPGLLALEQSVQLLLELGAARADSPLSELVLQNVAMIEESLTRNGFQVHLPTSSGARSGIVGVSWTGANYAAARHACLEQGVVLSVRGGRLRISTHAYNNSEDIHRLVDVLSHARDAGTAA